MTTIEISKLMRVSGGAGGDRSDLFRGRIEGGLKQNTGRAGSVDVTAGSFNGRKGTAKVTARPTWGGTLSGTCSADVVKDQSEIGPITCTPLMLQHFINR